MNEREAHGVTGTDRPRYHLRPPRWGRQSFLEDHVDVAQTLLTVAGIVAIVASVKPQAGSVRVGWVGIALIAFALALTN